MKVAVKHTPIGHPQQSTAHAIMHTAVTGGGSTRLRTHLHALLLGRRPAMLGMVDVATRETTLRVAARSFFVVVAFWWSATGAIFALERTAGTRWVGLMLASLLAVWGLLLMGLERDRETPSAARRSFLGGAFVWTWVQVLFYGDWLVGPAALRVAVPAQDPTFGFALRAAHAMLWYQLAMVGVLAVAYGLLRGHANRVGAWSLALFWVVHQLASVNIFVGVENPGRGFFPDAVAFLESYFGPARNSLLLPASLAMMLVFTLAVALHAVRGRTPTIRQGMMLLTVIGALSVLELAVLGAPIHLPLWDAFLAVRGY
jgi:putative photosynthetic complex assembly protein 2